MLLAIETSTNICSVAFKNQQGEIFEKRSEMHGSHSENLFLFIQELMKKHAFMLSDLDGVLVSEGPGSYTGLRIAASGVKGLLFGSDVPLYGVNTLASFAMAALNHQPEASKNLSDGQRIHSIIDARRKHLYHQYFEYINGKLTAKTEVEVLPITELEEMVEVEEIIIGTGLTRLGETLREKAICMDENFITAHSLIKLYENVEVENFMRKTASKKFEPKYYNI